MVSLGKNFPISDHYRENIVDARTVSRKGSWWSAVLAIKDPKNGKVFIGLYKWQNVNGEWRVRSKYNLRSQEEIQGVIDLVSEMAKKM